MYPGVMAYCTQTDLETAISEQTVLDLVDDDGDGVHNATTQARVTACITQADREIDGYCQAHYSVPFGTTPPLVANLSITISLFYLYRRRRNAFNMPDDVKEDYDRAMKKLEMVNSGKLDLGVEPPPASSSKVVADTDGPDQMFTHTKLQDM